MRTAVALTVVLVVAIVAPCGAVRYDLWRDWNSYNPSGPWSYGRFVGGASGAFIPYYERYTNPEADLITVNYVHWWDRGNWSGLVRYYGPTYDEVNTSLNHYGWEQTGEIRLNPGDGPVASADWGVIRWTAPAAGTARVSVGVYARISWSYCSIDVQVQCNRSVLAASAVRGFDGSPNQARVVVPGFPTRLVYSSELQLHAGDTLDVAVGNWNNSNAWDQATVECTLDFVPYAPDPAPAPAPPIPAWDVMSDTWVGTDALGRDLPGAGECGHPLPNRTVGIMYEPWLDEKSGAATNGPYCLADFFMEAARRGPYTLGQMFTDPEALQRILGDATLGWGPPGTGYYWAKPELGYYLSHDEYVIRKHAQMMANAGIDVIFVDLTNTIDYPESVGAVINTFKQIRAEGGKTPQIAFFLYWFSPQWVPAVYKLYVEPDPDSDLWYRWNGKPLLLCDPVGVHPDVLSQFTIRRTWGTTITGPDQWLFVSYYPQLVGHSINPYTGGQVPEEVAVSPMQGGEGTYGAIELGSSNFGRNYYDGVKPPYAQWDYSGRNYAQQWDRALQVGPPFIFITTWNETMVNIYQDPPGHYVDTGALCEEYSQDIQPMDGGFGDLCYYQTMANIRRYKGIRSVEAASPPKSISIDGAFSDWQDVFPEYRDDVGDTAHRDHQGWGFLDPTDPTSLRLRYTNFTGRNDLVRMKVSRDADYVYFYAEARGDLTPHTDPNWMLLFIDADCSGATGWHGYEYLVNSPPAGAATTTLKRWSGAGWALMGDVSYSASGSKLEVQVPRAWIGKGGCADFALDFHWADNIQSVTDIREFSLNGDSAPDRICKYHYTTTGGAPDTTPPTGTIWINFGAGYTCSRVVTLALNAVDSGSLVQSMRLSNDGAEWSEWAPYAPAAQWELTAGDGPKTVHVQFRDAAWNVSSGFSDSIALETAAPSGGIQVNGGSDYTSSISVVLSLSADDSGSGVVEMRLSNDGANWTPWQPFADSQTWELLPGDGAKTVFVRYRDDAGNESATYSDAIVLTSASQDSGITINSGAVYATNRSVSLALWSTGAVQMRLSNDHAAWSAWEPYAAVRSWTLSAGDGSKTVYAQFRNGSGVLSGVASDTVVLDTTAPVGVVSINDDAAYTNTATASLWLAAADLVSGVSQMKLSSDGVAWSEWEEYASGKSWTLVGGPGAKFVYVKYRDNAGNESAAFSAKTVLETDPPTGTVTINGGAAVTNTVAVALTLSAADSQSGVPRMRFSNDGASWSEWERYGRTKLWNLLPQDGERTVYVQYQDGAGNASSAVSDTIVLDSTTIRINGGARCTTNTNVNLSLSYAGSVQMRLGADGLDWGAWQAYSTSRSWSLTGSDGPKTVYAQFRDGSGLVSPSYGASIVLDRSGPTGSILVNSGAVYTASPVVDVSLFATDGASGVYQMKLSNNNVVWSAWESFAPGRTWTLPNGFGAKTVYGKFRDNAGNSSSSLSDVIVLVEHGGVSIPAAKALGDATWVGLSGKIVTAVFGDGFYLEEPDRSGGVLVKPAGGVLSDTALGDAVDLAGRMMTNSAGERYIESGLLSRR